MFQDLPQHLQHTVENFLKANDFRAAKAVHDDWMKNQHHQSPPPPLPQFHGL